MPVPEKTRRENCAGEPGGVSPRTPYWRVQGLTPPGSPALES